MRVFVVAAGLLAALVAVPHASADIGLTLTTLDVRVGGVLRGTGNGWEMPVYLVPESRAHRPYRCNTPRGRTYCYPRFHRPPGRPYVFIGRLAAGRGFRPRPWAFRVPRVAPGRYQVAIWCRSCRGSLFLAGDTLYGQVVTIRR